MRSDSVRPMHPRHPYRFFLSALLFLTLVGSAAVWWGLGGDLLPACLIGINAATLTLCGFDKSASRGTSLRVPEVVLLSGALLGGSLGLLLGMTIFRHKTQKPRFHLAIGLILLTQILVYRLMVSWDG